MRKKVKGLLVCERSTKRRAVWGMFRLIPKKGDVRMREYLTSNEADSLITAAGKIGRHRLSDLAI